MSAEEKEDLNSFGVAGRQRVAQSGGCTVAQVDDCIAKYLWMREMLAGVAKAKREGRPVPKSIEDMEQSLGESTTLMLFVVVVRTFRFHCQRDASIEAPVNVTLCA